MSYYYAATLEGEIGQVTSKVKEALQERGFGIVSEINFAETIKKKLNVDHPPYIILGACSPHHALKAVSEEPHIGLMLPCNVVVREVSPGKVEVSAIDPVASMAAVPNEKLAEVAQEVREKLKELVAALSS
ncbi:MAG: DUF302 domain-containing protein [Leptospiraceae bacterium]|nr:DUF302 domain-containing protein [Leptospiraceae bacterium]MDW8307532.1 DUF302 domain-containing protein [Leptospiraceae bacterium]